MPSPGSTCAVRKLDLLCTLLAVRPNMRDNEGGGGGVIRRSGEGGGGVDPPSGRCCCSSKQLEHSEVYSG